MAELDELIDQAIDGINRIGPVIRRQRGKQVAAKEPKLLVKATAMMWFKSIRPELSQIAGLVGLAELDANYRKLLSASECAASKTRYMAMLREIKPALVVLRADVISHPLDLDSADVPPPDFGSLVHDPAMQAVLRRRWQEARLCIQAGAYLAATVMMGSLLEALLLARVNSSVDKSPVFKAKTAPKDRSGNPLQLREWTLRHYIDVAHELGWIRQSARDVGEVLRDYRNYVHPAKEFAHNMVLDARDTDMFWAICVKLSSQVLSS